VTALAVAAVPAGLVFGYGFGGYGAATDVAATVAGRLEAVV
jgi:hypothetical protein